MFKQKLWIRGAGDLATGIAVRLFRSGFRPVMSEIKNPTTVRRTVAFSPAIYEKSTVVEDIKGQFCENLIQAEKLIFQNIIPVMDDEKGKIMHTYKPNIIVDAIMAKKNLNTNINDAQIVIAVGPGFTVGKDCHAVIETKRGHNLGRVLWQGTASKNTGIPGEISGESVNRIIRATNDGKFKSVSKIGDLVKKGDIVGYSGDCPMYAKIDGVVRGLLQDGVNVFAGMKSGDIDPRGNIENCYTISDKASAIGGGVLEAILSLLN